MRGDASVPSDESGWHLRSEAAYLRDFFCGIFRITISDNLTSQIKETI